jgi:hypothetical protein
VGERMRNEKDRKTDEERKEKIIMSRRNRRRIRRLRKIRNKII